MLRGTTIPLRARTGASTLTNGEGNTGLKGEARKTDENFREWRSLTKGKHRHVANVESKCTHTHNAYYKAAATEVGFTVPLSGELSFS